MRTLYSYLLRQVLVTLFMTVAICTFVLLLGNVLKEVVNLLLSGQATLGLFARALGLLIPYVLVFALPVGLLAATLLAFGRLSADNELTAMRANGISLLSLSLPLVVMSLFFAGLCAYINLEVAPKARVEYKSLFVKFVVKQTLSFLQEDQFIHNIPGVTLYVGKRDGNELRDVRFYQHQNDQVTLRATADRGEILLDMTNKTLSLRLHQAIIEQRVRDSGDAPEEGESVDWQPVQADFQTPTFALENLIGSIRQPKLSEMSFAQLRRKAAELEQQGVPAMPAKIQMHRQLSFSFACVAFTLIGIPLGIRAHRRETSIGIGIALLLLVAYYSFFILGEALQARPAFYPHVLLWVPNILFQMIGGWLLWRANKGV